MRIKIALVLDILALGGTQRAALGICKHINKNKFDVELIFLNEPKKNLERLENIKHTTRNINSVNNYLNGKKFDIIFAYSNLQNLHEIKGKVIRPVIFSTQYNESNDLNLMSSITEYIKIKHTIKKEPKNSEVVYLQLDEYLWNKTKDVKQFYKPNNNITLGRLGREEPSKWHWLILSTLLRLKESKKIDNYNFIFMGMPNLYKLFINIFFKKQLKNKTIQLFRETSDQKMISKFYNSLDVFIQTSWIGESFGCVITESFFHKKPVITDWKSFVDKEGNVKKELYDTQIEIVNPECGYYVKHPIELENVITTLNKDVLKKKGMVGYNKTMNKYISSVVVKNFENILLNRFYNGKNKINPSKQDIKDCEKEYFIKIKKLKNGYNKLNFLSRNMYSVSSFIWRVIEYVYLILRKIKNKTKKYI